MKILINDLMQFSNIPDDLKTPSLSDRYPNTGSLSIAFAIPNAYSSFISIDGVLSQPLKTLSQPLKILSQPIYLTGSNQFDCIGIGGTDATQIVINGNITINSPDGKAFKDGLYDINQSIVASNITLSHNGSYMGRIAVGLCRNIPISPSREPGFYTSVRPRTTLSGQVVPTAGGYGGWAIGVDFRYKIDKDIIEDFNRGYVTQIMQGFPFFISFENDKWLPVDKFYGQTDNNIIFQSSINAFKFSKRFEFRQAF